MLAATTANDYDLAQRKGTSMSRTAVIAGVGPGLGASLARRLAAEGCTIGLLSRTMDFTEGLAAKLSAQGSTALAMATDIADEAAVDFSSAKFGMRGLADSMARELWPQGIHVAHIIVDGMIDTASLRQNYQLAEDEALLDPEDIAQVCWDLVTQRRGAWSFEVDVRPHREVFFE